ncbi:unnamed protein product [Anisakis simplex]|uniref:Small vasohibin-binding protein n=1 Tax=Anisakis simplex TaxID=6269 RepID=A0A0M3KAC9_ANISI|nr:unnamed protein product [Anisakis simplex]
MRKHSVKKDSATGSRKPRRCRDTSEIDQQIYNKKMEIKEVQRKCRAENGARKKERKHKRQQQRQQHGAAHSPAATHNQNHQHQETHRRNKKSSSMMAEHHRSA